MPHAIYPISLISYSLEDRSQQPQKALISLFYQLFSYHASNNLSEVVISNIVPLKLFHNIATPIADQQ
jgi:hypothetical protein